MKRIILFLTVALLFSCSSRNIIKYELPAELIGDEIKVVLGDDINKYKHQLQYNSSVKDYSYNFKEKVYFDAIYMWCKEGKIAEIILESFSNINIDNSINIKNLIQKCNNIWGNEMKREEITRYLNSGICFTTIYWEIMNGRINIKLDYIPYSKIQLNKEYFKNIKVDTIPIDLRINNLSANEIIYK